jgi:hypothetical protein
MKRFFDPPQIRSFGDGACGSARASNGIGVGRRTSTVALLAGNPALAHAQYDDQRLSRPDREGRRFPCTTPPGM